MLLVATWHTRKPIEPSDWQTRTPVGYARTSLRPNAGAATLCCRVTVDAPNVYVKPGRFSAVGSLAFVKLPDLEGQRASLQLTAVPALWLGAPQRVSELFARLQIRAQILGRTLRASSDDLSPSLLIQRVGTVSLALDPFTKSRASESKLAEFRRHISLDSDHDWLFDLLQDNRAGGSIRKALLIEPKAVAPQRREHELESKENLPNLVPSHGPPIRIDASDWESAGKQLRAQTVDPRWIIYLPPETCTIQKDPLKGALEHPQSALEYYRDEGIREVVVHARPMGSRAVVIVCRNAETARRRFRSDGIGCAYTRNGRPLLTNPDAFLLSLQQGFTKARLWQALHTDWICLDGECLPWWVKADRLFEQTYAELLESGSALQKEFEASRKLLSPEEREVLTARGACFDRYRSLLDRLERQRDEPLRFAPTQLIATEGKSYFDRTNLWQMETLRTLCREVGEPLSEVPYQFLSVGKPSDIERCATWWIELSETLQKGFVVKPIYGVPRGRRGSAQPSILCRTPEHLRLVYGPDYDLLENSWALANRDALQNRREKHRRVLKQFALAMESTTRFVRGAQVSPVEDCIRAILTLQQR